MNARALSAEFIGTFMLVFSIVVVALLQPASAGPNLAVPLSVGITVMAVAYALGPISGGHFNPAVTLGLVAAGRFDAGKASATSSRSAWALSPLPPPFGSSPRATRPLPSISATSRPMASITRASTRCSP